MKKIIATVIVMVILMTSAGAFNANNNRNFGDYIREGVSAQLTVKKFHHADSWGLPMTKTRIDLFGKKNFYVQDVHDFSLK